MTHRSIRSMLLSAAVAAALGLTATARAQYQVNNSHVLDANNRVGGGANNPNDNQKRVGEQVSGNDIVYGNVSGGKQFRGTVPYTDPRAFRGQTADRNIDEFVRSSSGPDSRLSDTVVPFYGSGRGVAPPPGFVQTSPGSGAYVPAPIGPTRVSGDTRVGDLNVAQPQIALPRPGELFLPGQVDPSAGQMYIAASPLFGIKQFSPQEMSGTTVNTQYNPVTGTQMDQQTMQRMRDELNQAAGLPVVPSGTGVIETNQNDQTNPNSTNPNGTNPNGTGPGGALPNGNTQPAPGKNGSPGAQSVPGATPIVAQPIQQPIANAQPINTSVSPQAGQLTTSQGTRQNIVSVPPPEKQSAVYAALLQRYQQASDAGQMTEEEAQRKFNQLQQQAEKDKLAQGQQTPGATPPGAAAPGAATPGAAAPGAVPPPADQTTVAGTPDYAKHGEELLKHGAEKDKELRKKLQKPEPVKVPSLSSGMKGKGLAEIMKNAEDLMKQGKFTSALDQYDRAEQVAPNNPLIKLGRANAELGASYYARAEAHLREVLTKNPALLDGQYDLSAMLGEQRLQVLVKDLKEVSNRDQREPRPVFLLAYIAYNTGHEQNAEAYLDLADKRSGGKDPFFKLLRDNWSLPGATTQPAAEAQPEPAPAATPQPNQ